MVTIRAMLKADINAVGIVHSAAFTRQRASEKWVSCNFNAYPRIMMFVATNDMSQIIGYIQWIQKSGFRKESVIELEQIAVLPDFRRKSIGSQLINQSLIFVKEYLLEQNSTLKSIIVTTRTDNAAQKLYQRVLNAKICATINDLYSHDEVIMVSQLNSII